MNSPMMHLIDARSPDAPLHSFKIHKAPVCLLAYHAASNSVISVDTKGFVECWSAEPPFGEAKGVTYEMKSETDLYAFVKAKAIPTSIQVSRDGSKWVAMATDRQVRVFSWKTGRIIRQ